MAMVVAVRLIGSSCTTTAASIRGIHVLYDSIDIIDIIHTIIQLGAIE